MLLFQLTNIRNVFNDDRVVWFLAGLVEDVVRLDHVVDDVALGYLFGAELLRRRQVLAVVVAQVVVADDRHRFQAGADQKVDQHRLQLGLARFEVVAADEHVELLGQFDAAGHERVLRRSVDEGALQLSCNQSVISSMSAIIVGANRNIDYSFQDAGHGEQSRRRHFVGVLFDGAQQVFSRVVESRDNVGEAFSIGRPQDDHLVQLVGSFKVLDVAPDLIHLLLAAARHDVVSPLRLVGGDEVWAVNRRAGFHFLHIRAQLILITYKCNNVSYSTWQFA